jgi:hypothetical protein
MDTEITTTIPSKPLEESIMYTKTKIHVKTQRCAGNTTWLPRVFLNAENDFRNVKKRS